MHEVSTRWHRPFSKRTAGISVGDAHNCGFRTLPQASCGRSPAGTTRRSVNPIGANMPRAALIGRLGFRSALGIPLIVRGEVTAILEMFSPEKKTPNDASLQLA